MHLLTFPNLFRLVVLLMLLALAFAVHSIWGKPINTEGPRVIGWVHVRAAAIFILVPGVIGYLLGKLH